MKLINIASTSEYELRWGSKRDLAAGLWIPDDLDGITAGPPGSPAEPVELERGVLIEQQYIGLMGGEGWGLHDIAARLNHWLPMHLRAIGGGFRDPKRADGPPDADYAGALVLDVYESFRPIFELAGTAHREAWRGVLWGSMVGGLVPSPTHFDVPERYERLALQLGLETIAAYRRVYPRARIGITTIPGEMLGTEWMADAHRGLVYSGRATDRRAALNDRLRPLFDACDFGVATCFLRALSDEQASRGLGVGGVDPWWARQELPADVTEAYLAGNCLEATRCLRGKPVFAIFAPVYQGDVRGPYHGELLSLADMQRLWRVPASCGVSGWLYFDSVKRESEWPDARARVGFATSAAALLVAGDGAAAGVQA